MSTDVVILSGAGRYADPWHPFPQTSPLVAQVVEGLGLSCQLRDLDDPGVLDPGDARLVIVNAGTSDAPADDAWTPGFQAFGDWIDAGGPVLSLHISAATFPDWPRWRQLLGGAWTTESHHPEMAVGLIQALDGQAGHPVFAGLPDGAAIDPSLAGVPVVTAIDERYSGMDLDLEGDDAITPIMGHLLGDHLEVSGWTHGRRVLQDSLGHDARSYASETRRRLLANEIGWLLDA